MADAHALDALADALKRLPGVGVRTAARMAYHLLQHDRAGALQISAALAHAVESVRHCALCHTFTEQVVCSTCLDPARNRQQLCVVETPADQAALERTGAYKGLFFVLMGRLSPLDHLGPQDIGLPALFERLDGATLETPAVVFPAVSELILATNFTAEGESTAHIIAQSLKPTGLRITRLSRGVPVGSELEYVDLGTIAHALVDRRSALD